ncbi:MAG: GNAT family N-acetyltransferase [Alphaproteobacteria bacterium]
MSGAAGDISVERLDAAGLDRRVDRLAEILRACVHDGASVNFVLPFDTADAARFWREKARPGVAAGRIVLLAASIDGEIAGTAQLVLVETPNQAHRAEVAKVLTHPAMRRRGVPRRGFAAVESPADAHGRSLLVLDTRTGDAAERLYVGLGYRIAGVVPGFARHPAEPQLEGATVLYKRLTESSSKLK